MIKIWSMKKDEETAKKKGTKTSSAQLRVQKDITEMGPLPSTMKLHFPNPADLLNFTFTVEPDEGMYKNGSFVFTFAIPLSYPHDPPKVKCTQKLYHPNIDLQGNVCLNVLREDWKPIMDLNNVFPGLLYLFLEPNGGDPLNKEAADELRRDKAQFASTVKRTMAGGSVKGVAYDKVVMK